MTDNEIIKALECCINYSECSKCPLNTGAAETNECKSECMAYALDLINSLQSEIERYKGVRKLLEKNVKNANAEIKKLRKDPNKKCGTCAFSKPTNWGNSKSKVYVECTNEEHKAKFCKRKLAEKRPRTTPACKLYAEREAIE